MKVMSEEIKQICESLGIDNKETDYLARYILLKLIIEQKYDSDHEQSIEHRRDKALQA